LPLFWGDDRQVAEIALKGFITKRGVRQDAATLAAGFDKGLGLSVYQPKGQMVVSRYGGTGASIRNMLSVALGFLDKQPFYQARRFGLYQFPPRLEFFSLEVKVQNLQVAGNFAADDEKGSIGVNLAEKVVYLFQGGRRFWNSFQLSTGIFDCFDALTTERPAST
jgi:hypothetical protein